MKKHLFVSVLLLLFSLGSSSLMAQAFTKGTKLVDAGFEIQETFDETIVPIFGNFEIGVTDDIGVGGKLRFWSKDDVNSMVVQATGAYHFGRLMNLSNDKLDIFAGLGLGINHLWVKNYSEYSMNSLIVSPSIGVRYFFNEKFGVTSKLGFDTYRYDYYNDYGYSTRYTSASFAVGVSFKF